MPSRRDSGRNADRHLRTDHLQADLSSRSIRGGVVTIAAQAVKIVLQVGAIMLMARLLAPGDFGLFAVVLALLSVFELFKDLGLSSATVQRPEISDAQVSTLFWLNVGLAMAIAALFAASAPLLAAVYENEILLTLTPAVAVSLVMTGISAQNLALLRRQMRFRAVVVVQVGADVLALGAAVVAAYAGFGIWALAVQRLTWAFAMAAGASLASGWRPGRLAAWRDVRGLVGFGANATGAMVLGRIAGSADKMVIGWYWGASMLGFFERAQKLIMMPVQNVNTPLTTVALPMLSRLVDDPDRYESAYRAVMERLLLIMAPAAALVVMAHESLTLVLLGPQWRDAAPILAWLGASLLYMPLTYTLSWLYMSQDRTGEMLRANMANVVLKLIGLFAALPFGPVAVAAVYTVTGGLVRTPMLLWFAGRRGPVGYATFAGSLVLPLAAAGAAAGGIALLQGVDTVTALSNLLRVLLFGMVAGGVVLVVYMAIPRGRRLLFETVRRGRLPSMQEAGA